MLRLVTMGRDGQREEIRRQSSLVLETARNQPQPADDEEIRDMGRRVEEALVGNLEAAFADRAGETRSV